MWLLTLSCGDPTLRTIVSSLGGLSNYFTYDDTWMFSNYLLPPGVSEVHPSSKQDVFWGAVTLEGCDSRSRSQNMPNKTLPAVLGCVVHSTIFLYIYIFSPLFSYPSLFFVKPLNFFTKSGCFGSEGLWRSNS